MQFQSESRSLRDVPVTNEGFREVSFRDQDVRVILHYHYGAGYIKLHRENYEFLKFNCVLICSKGYIKFNSETKAYVSCSLNPQGTLTKNGS
jgi:hypothetical protein